MNQVALTNQSNKAKYGDNLNSSLSGMRSALDSQGARKTDALKGMTDLYGTTPALVNTYGNITQDQQKINNQATDNKARNRLSMFNTAARF